MHSCSRPAISLRKFSDEFYSNFPFVVAFVNQIDTCGEVKRSKLFLNMEMLSTFFYLIQKFDDKMEKESLINLSLREFVTPDFKKALRRTFVGFFCLKLKTRVALDFTTRENVIRAKFLKKKNLLCKTLNEFT